LRDVIEFYDRGGDPAGTFMGTKEIHPLHLTQQEKQDLEKFLKTLTGDLVPHQYVQDIHNP